MNITHSIRQHLEEILPPALFFLVSFSLLFATRALISREYGMSVPGFGIAVAGALLVGKVVMYADKLPFVDLFPDRPLLYNACWKSAIYFLASLLVRFLKPVVPLLLNHESLADATQNFVNTTAWPEFWLVQMWLAVLFFVYCTAREMVRALGRDKIVRMFFGG